MFPQYRPPGAWDGQSPSSGWHASHGRREPEQPIETEQQASVWNQRLRDEDAPPRRPPQELAFGIDAQARQRRWQDAERHLAGAGGGYARAEARFGVAIDAIRPARRLEHL